MPLNLNPPLLAFPVEESTEGRALAVNPMVSSADTPPPLAPGREVEGVAEGDAVLRAWEAWPTEWGAREGCKGRREGLEW